MGFPQTDIRLIQAIKDGEQQFDSTKVLHSDLIYIYIYISVCVCVREEKIEKQSNP